MGGLPQTPPTEERCCSLQQPTTHGRSPSDSTNRREMLQPSATNHPWAVSLRLHQQKRDAVAFSNQPPMGGLPQASPTEERCCSLQQPTTHGRSPSGFTN